MTDKLMYNLTLKKTSNIILSFDTKISKNEAVLLKSDTIKNCADSKFYERLKNLGILDIQTFLKMFRADCELYMLDSDRISVNSYLNFLEVIKK